MPFPAKQKYAILDHIQRIRQPYTVIEVGRWYQTVLPAVPSGRLDPGKGNGQVIMSLTEMVGGRSGSQPSALMDLRDVGRWVARIIAAPGDATLNMTVSAYAEVRTESEVWDLVEKFSGEKPADSELAQEVLEQQTEAAEAAVTSSSELDGTLILAQYRRSWHLRGDNTPEVARYLGFVNAWDLFPDFEPLGLEAFVREALA